MKHALLVLTSGLLMAIVGPTLTAEPDGSDSKSGPPMTKGDTKGNEGPPVDSSGQTKLKEVKSKDATTRARKARDQAQAAKEAYERALAEADQADNDAAVAEAEYRASVARDMTTRAENARAEAERAVADAKSADDDRKEAERLATEAMRRVRGGAAAAPPAASASSPVNNPANKTAPRNSHPATNEDLSRYLKKTEPPKEKTAAASESVKRVAVDRGPEPATIVAVVLPNATVAIDGKVTSQTGPTRTFNVPPLAFGRNYTYRLTVSGPAGKGGPTMIRDVTVRAGETTTEDFTK